MELAYLQDQIYTHFRHHIVIVMKDMKEMIVLNYHNVGVFMEIVSKKLFFPFLGLILLVWNVNVYLAGMEDFVIMKSMISHQKQIQFFVDLQLKLPFLLELQFLNKV